MTSELDMISRVGDLLNDERIRSIDDESDQGLHILDRFIGQTIARGTLVTIDGTEASPQYALDMFAEKFGDRNDAKLMAIPGLQSATNLLSDDPRLWNVYQEVEERVHYDTEDGEYYLGSLAQMAGYLSMFDLPPGKKNNFPWRQVLLDDTVDQLVDEDYTMSEERSARLRRAVALAKKAGADDYVLFNSAAFMMSLQDDGEPIDFSTQLVYAASVPDYYTEPRY